MEYMHQSNWMQRVDEFSMPKFLSKSIGFIKDIATKTSLKLSDVLKVFANKKVFEFFQKVKWSLDYLFKLIKDGHAVYKNIISAIAEYVAKSKVGKWTEDTLKGLDNWLQNHPKTKRIGGVVVAGLLIYIWFNMTFIGDERYDFDLTDVFAALSGKFTLSTLFAGTSGTQLLMLFATGVIGLSFPWPGPTSVKFLYAMIKSFANWTKIKLHKESISEISSVTGRFAGEWQQDIPEPQFILPNKKRILNAIDGKPEIWFDRGGYTQLHFPIASKIFSDDDESQKMYAKYSIKNTGVKYELDLNPSELNYEDFNSIKLGEGLNILRRLISDLIKINPNTNIA